MSAPSQATPRPSQQPTVRLECDTGSAQGGRAENEDAVAWNELDAGVLAIIADGMGGGLDGKLFSQAAVASVQSTVISARAGVDTPQLTHALKTAASELHAMRASEPRYHASGTTLVVAGVVPTPNNAKVCVLHVGDSRAYAIRANGKLEPLTRDHTYAEQLVRQQVPAAEAYRHPQALRLVHALGDDLDFDRLLDYQQTTQLAPGDSLLLCTDGVCKQLSDAELVAAVAGRSAQAAVAQLLEQALQNAASKHVRSDNATALVVRCLPAPTRRRPMILGLLLTVIVVIALAFGALAFVRAGQPDLARLTPEPTITAPAEATRPPERPVTSTPRFGATSTLAPSVLPSPTPTNTPTNTPSSTPTLTRTPRPPTRTPTPSPFSTASAVIVPTETPVTPTVAPVEPSVVPTVAPVEPSVVPTVAPVEPPVTPTVAPVEPPVTPTVAPTVSLSI